SLKTCEPSATLKPRTTPSRLAVKTTSLATAAPPRAIDGNRASHLILPVAASMATSSPDPSPQSDLVGAQSVPLKQPGRVTTGTKTVPLATAIGVSTPPRGPGKTSRS